MINNEKVDTSEMFKAWGIAYAKANGYKIEDNATVYLEAETEGDGCCEMCYAEYAVMYLVVDGNRIQLDKYEFSG